MRMPPFVLQVPSTPPAHVGPIDAYYPESSRSADAPAIVFVHGGPRPAGLLPPPTESSMFVGYGSFAAAHGAVGVTFNHRLHAPSEYAAAADDVAAALDAARRLPGVDADRVALWFFSGAGLLLADWLRETPSWLRCVAGTYPALVPFPGWDVEPRFRPIEAVADAGGLPLLLTRAGRDRDEVLTGIDAFVAAARSAGTATDVIDVPNGQHAFELLDDTDESRRAITQAMEWVTNQLRTHEQAV